MTDDEAIDFAWKVHGALRDWTGKVDTKASFALTFESVAVGLIVNWSTGTGPLVGLEGWALLRYRIGVGLLVFSMLAAAGAVIPRTRWRSLRDEWKTNYIYFGHLRYWGPDSLVRKWQSDDPYHVLARQHVVMARIAWQKHVLLQLSLVGAALGVASVGTTL